MSDDVDLQWRPPILSRADEFTAKAQVEYVAGSPRAKWLSLSLAIISACGLVSIQDD
jgi:hypothetical protein